MSLRLAVRSLVPLILISTVVACTTPASTDDVRKLTPEQAHALLADRGDEVYVLDVRTAGEFERGRIPMVDGRADWHNWKRAFTAIRSEIDESTPILVYCHTGNRSGQAASWLADHGYSRVMNLSGGISGWAEAGLPIER